MFLFFAELCLEDRFEEFLKTQKELDRPGCDFLRTYEGHLFDNSSWFYALDKMGQELFTSNSVVKEVLQEEVELIITPKNIEIERPLDSDVVSDPVDFNLSQILSCTKCQKSFGPLLESSLNSPIKVMFVGDYPREKNSGDGFDSRFLGGEKGELVKKMASALGLQDGEYYRSLCIKCTPQEDEALFKNYANCMHFLFQEIIILKPKVIVAFGNQATQLLLGDDKKVSEIHGQFFEKNFTHLKDSFETLVMPTMHLDLILVNSNIKRSTWEDLKQITDKIC